MTEPRGRRKNNKPWKHIYGVDRGYTARVDRLRARVSPAEPPTTPAPHPNPTVASQAASG